MTLTRKDAVATGLTGLAVLAFVATYEAWNVPLVGDSPADSARRSHERRVHISARTTDCHPYSPRI